MSHIIKSGTNIWKVGNSVLSSKDRSSYILNRNIAITEPYSIAFHPDKLTYYVSIPSTNVVLIKSVADNSTLYTVSGFNTPVGVTVHPNGLTYYVCNYGNSTLSVRSVATNLELYSISGFSNTHSVAVHPNGLTYYVSSAGNSTLSIRSVATNLELYNIAIGDALRGIAFHPSGLTYYVCKSATGVVSVRSVANNIEIATISTPNCSNIVYSFEHNLLYCQGDTPNAYVINPSSNSIIATLVGVIVGTNCAVVNNDIYVTHFTYANSVTVFKKIIL